jgi:DNA polymerase-3 subunit alpha
MTAISISEHGRPLNWVSKKLYAESKGLKYIHSCEVYLTESLEEKIRDNYHCVCLCKNYDGVRELNELISLAGTDEQFYYVPRITFDQFVNISNNIITTSACLASALNKLPEDNPWYEKLAKKFTYYEVQPHNNVDQKRYNDKLAHLAKKYDKPLIAGVDAHSLDKYHDECRDVLMVAKHKYYGDEGFDLTWKTYDELVEAFKSQGILYESEYLDAIENTNRMAEQIEEFEIDPEFKYPILYGSREKDSEMFSLTVEKKFQEKLERGVIPQDQKDAFREAIDDEMDVFSKLKMSGFMLSMANIVNWAKDQGMPIGPSRGSVGGSRVAYVTDIIDVNPETWHLNFYRFANPDRLDAGDIDVDCTESDRPKIFQHIIEEFGRDKTADEEGY